MCVVPQCCSPEVTFVASKLEVKLEICCFHLRQVRHGLKITVGKQILKAIIFSLVFAFLSAGFYICFNARDFPKLSNIQISRQRTMRTWRIYNSLNARFFR